MSDRLFETSVSPDWEEMRSCCILRQGTPRRVHNFELFLDGKIRETLARRFHLWDSLDADDPYLSCKQEVAIQRFLGYDYVGGGVEGMALTFQFEAAEDTAGLKRSTGRQFMTEGRGPITNWDDIDRSAFIFAT